MNVRPPGYCICCEKDFGDYASWFSHICPVAINKLQETHFQDAVNHVVNHPDHYGGDTTYETIKVIEAWELNFHLGSAVKYISRAGIKDPSKHVEDLEKAIWYIRREIEIKQRSESVKQNRPYAHQLPPDDCI